MLWSIMWMDEEPARRLCLHSVARVFHSFWSDVLHAFVFRLRVWLKVTMATYSRKQKQCKIVTGNFQLRRKHNVRMSKLL